MSCRIVTEMVQAKIDEAFDNGKISVFKNMIKDGVPREQAQKYAEISDKHAEMALAEM